MLKTKQKSKICTLNLDTFNLCALRVPQAAADYSPFWIDFPLHWILFAGIISLGFFRNWTYHLRSAGMDWISLYCGFIPPHTRRTRYLNFFPLNLSPPASLLNNALRNKSKALYGLLALPIQQSSTGKAAQFTHRELHEQLPPTAMAVPALPCHGAPMPGQCWADALWWEGAGGWTDSGACEPWSPSHVHLRRS